MNTHQYIESVKAKTGILSDYGVAKLFGIERSAMSNYKRGVNCFDNRVSFKVAEVLGVNPATVIADMERERAEKAGKADQASAWRDWLEKLGGVAAALLMGTLLSAPSPASASMRTAVSADPLCILCQITSSAKTYLHALH